MIEELTHERDQYKLNFDHYHKESSQLDKELQELKFKYNYLERDFKRQEEGMEVKLKELD